MNKGQASLVVLLLMAVGMSLGLAVSKEVSTDIEISKNQEESSRAFSAAEAGVEEALSRWQVGEPAPETINLESGTATVNSEELGKDKASFLFPNKIEKGDYAVVWLADHQADGSINETSGGYNGSEVNLCWESQAAIEVVLFYKTNSGDYKTSDWAFDPNGSRRASNHFAAPTGNCLGLGAGEKLTLPAEAAPPNGKPLFLLVKVFYSPVQLGAMAEGESLFPSQGQVVTSTGEVVSGESEKVSRRLKVFQTWDLPPFVFLAPIFVNGSTQG